MELQTIKDIISSLNRDAFSKLTLELWRLLDCSNDYEYKKTSLINEMGNDVYEQHFWTRESRHGVYDRQGYHLIIPYFQPIELFTNINDNSFTTPEIINKLNKYKAITEERTSSWQFWTDGDYVMPYISFFTNFKGIEKDFYLNTIIPKFESLLEQIDLEGIPAVGSCDSIIELNPQNTIIALQNFFSRNNGEISISLSNEKMNVEYFNSDKYLSSGLLKNSKNPYEPIFIETQKNKSEIVKEFESLINRNTSERDLESFLKKYYREIFGEHYDRIETQLWLRFPELDIANKNRRLDIFLRNSIERDWELFELKRAHKLTRTYRDIPTFTSEIHHAIQQIRNYERILGQEKVKQKFAREGIEYYYPELRLVLGNKPDISDEQWRFLKTTNENRLKIVTFEDLIMEMKTRYNIHANYMDDTNVKNR